MRNVSVAALAAVALVAVPAASADPGKGKLRSERKAQHESDRSDSRGGKEGKRALRKCKRERRGGFLAAGTASAQGSGSFVLTVKRANRPARNWLAGNDPTFSTAGVTLRLKGVSDSTGDGIVDLADVLSTDRVKVIGKLSRPKRGCAGEASLELRRVVVHRKAEAGETEGEESELEEAEDDESEFDEVDADEVDADEPQDDPVEEEPVE